MSDTRRVWPLLADHMNPDALGALDAVLDEWAGVSLFAATVDDLNAALASLGLLHDAAVKLYAERLTADGIAAVEAHANGDCE